MERKDSVPAVSQPVGRSRIACQAGFTDREVREGWTYTAISPPYFPPQSLSAWTQTPRLASKVRCYIYVQPPRRLHTHCWVGIREEPLVGEPNEEGRLADSRITCSGVASVSIQRKTPILTCGLTGNDKLQYIVPCYACHIVLLGRLKAC